MKINSIAFMSGAEGGKGVTIGMNLAAGEDFGTVPAEDMKLALCTYLGITKGGAAAPRPESGTPEGGPEAAAGSQDDAKPTSRRRRGAAKDEAKDEGADEAPKAGRKRRGAAKDKGPSAEDCAKILREAAEVFESDWLAEVVMDYAEDGKVESIPADKRYDFITYMTDAINEPED